MALASSKEATAKPLQESTRESIQTMKTLISDSLMGAHCLTQKTQKFSRFTLVSSATLFAVSCIVILLFCK